MVVGERFKRSRNALMQAKANPKWIAFAQSKSTLWRRHIGLVQHVENPKFWAYLNFFLSFMQAFVIAVRCFDTAAAGSVCFLYRFLGMLPVTVQRAFEKEQDKTIATQELLEKLILLVNRKWKDLHYPIYSAGYVLCPYFAHEVPALYRKTDSIQVARQLEKDTIDCCVTVCCRFDEDGKLREAILAPNDPIQPNTAKC